MSNYPIGDFLIQVKNAYLGGKKSITFPYSKVVASIAAILVDEKYASKVREAQMDKRRTLHVELLYYGRTPALSNVHLISKPSLHRFVNKTMLLKYNRGSGIKIFSTSKGVMTGRKAAKQGVGGELICEIN